MKIGIIGSGHIGAAVAHICTRAGHDVALSNSRGPQSLGDLVAEVGDRAHTASVEDAARFGEVVLLAVPFGVYKQLPVAAMRDKVVIDATNYYPERDGQFAQLDSQSTTSSELVSDYLPGARLVKGFNTMKADQLKTAGDPALPLEKRQLLFIAGDDSGAKEIVAALIADIGFAADDTGFLHEGGMRQQKDGPLYLVTVTGEAAKSLSGA